MKPFILNAVLVLLLIGTGAWLFRYEVVQVGTVAYELDRWTGQVWGINYNLQRLPVH